MEEIEIAIVFDQKMLFLLSHEFRKKNFCVLIQMLFLLINRKKTIIVNGSPKYSKINSNAVRAFLWAIRFNLIIVKFNSDGEYLSLFGNKEIFSENDELLKRLIIIDFAKRRRFICDIFIV
jgi:hypothetical protein